MKYLYPCVLVLALTTGGCARQGDSAFSIASMTAAYSAPTYATNVTPAAVTSLATAAPVAAASSTCYNLMTIGGGLKQKCSQ